MKSAYKILAGVSSVFWDNSKGQFDNIKTQPVRNMQCQVIEGTYVFDLLPFDSIGSKENPTSVEMLRGNSGNGWDFQYKVCQDTWKSKDTKPEMTGIGHCN